jgi:protein phosphatase
VKILVIADIHGNAEALRAVLDAEADADTTIFLGDAVSPGPQANETIALLSRLNGTFIVGNHDREILEPERTAHWPEDWKAYNDWVTETLEPDGLEFLRNLRPNGEYAIADMDLHLHHGDLADRPHNVLPDTPEERVCLLAEGSNAPYVLFGHCHVQFSLAIGEQRFINPGSVGQNRCGHLLACYGVFADGVYEPRRVPFDPAPWLAAVDRIPVLDAYPGFRNWLKEGLLAGYGIGRTEPWTQLATAGYF